MYPNAGNNIGTLLRLIQEDQNKNIASLPPSADPNSPIRGVVQGPLMSNEAPGSNRVVSVRPEGVTAQGPEATPGQVVGPTVPVANPGVGPSVVGPSTPSMGGGQSNPVSAPSIGTTIKASAPTSQGFIGPQAFIGPTKPANVSTPVSNQSATLNQSTNVGSSRIGGLGLGTKITSAAEKTSPSLLESVLGKAGKILGPIGTVIGADQLLKSIMGGSFLSPKKAY
jgi:hypothetical protein